MAFVENKVKVIIFGAGGGGRNYKKEVEKKQYTF